MTRRAFALVALALLFAACTPSVGEVPIVTPEPPTVTNTPIPTNEPEPTQTPRPTSTPEPTSTPSPTPLPYYTAEEAEKLAGMEAVNPEEYGRFVFGNQGANYQIQQREASQKILGRMQLNKELNGLTFERGLEFFTQEVGRIFGYDSAEAYRAAREAGEVRSITFTWGANTYIVDSDKPVVVVFDANPEPPDYVPTGNMLVEANEVIEQQDGWFDSPDTTGPDGKSSVYWQMRGEGGHLLVVAGTNFNDVPNRYLGGMPVAESSRALFLAQQVMENGGKPRNGMIQAGGALNPHAAEFDFGSDVGLSQAIIYVEE